MIASEHTWPIARAGEALVALAEQTGIVAHHRVQPPPLPAVLAEPDPVALERWLAGLAAGIGLEVEPAGCDLAGARELLRGCPPALLRVGPAGQALLLVLRRRRRSLEILGPDLRRHSLEERLVHRVLCDPVVAPVRGQAQALLDRLQLRGRRRERVRETLLEQRFADAHIGRAFLVRPAPSAPLRHLLRSDGLLGRVLALVATHALELVLTVGAWWLIGTQAFSGRADPGWMLAWLLLLLTIVPCRMGQAALAGEIVRRVGAILKRRLLVGAMAMPEDRSRREGAGRLLGRVLETSTVESLGLRGGLVSAIAGLELIAAVPILASGPAPALHLSLLASWGVLSCALIYRTGLHLRAWTEERNTLTHRVVEAMVGHRTRVTQQAPERWHDHDDACHERVLAHERALDRSEARLVAVLPRGWLVLGVAALLPAFVEASATGMAIATALGGVLLAQRGLSTFVAGATALLGAAVALGQVTPMLRGAVAIDGAGQGAMLSLPPVAPGQPLLVARGLGFRHPTCERPILRDVELEIAAGDRLLLEGGSGGGKSTLGSILAGLREPTTGLVLLAGLDRPTLGLAGWRRRVAAAPQFHDNHIVTGTLAFNLLMGRRWPATPHEQAEAEAVCRELGLGELLDRMPSGLMQMVGETGWQLSHGERSRVFMARALLQRVDLVVLDESFAALDPETLQRALRCVMERARTVLVIAHP